MAPIDVGRDHFHFPQGFWAVANGGIPAALYRVVWLYFSAAGADPWSVDAWFQREAGRNALAT